MTMTLADYEMSLNRKKTRCEVKLDKINDMVSWNKVEEMIKGLDYTSELGGRKPISLLQKTKMLFLQHLYNFSDPELEDSLHDRISFQRFVGISASQSIPDFSTLWRFRERLIEHDINDKLFDLIIEELSIRGLLVKKGTIMDSTIISSSNRPLSKKKREKLKETPSSQIDTDADSTEKRGKKYFGYKGHIGTDVGSKLIRKRTFTSARPHDSTQKKYLLSGDEEAKFGDNAYSKQEDKREARKNGVYYGILDKATRKRKLSNKQKKTNKKKTLVRNQVEHPFAYIKERLNYKVAVAKELMRNGFRADMNCIIYNIMRASFLIKKQKAEATGLVKMLVT